MISLIKMLKGKKLRIALLQDKIITNLFTEFDNLILHGGTAIWRVFRGKRFSYDIDLFGKNVKEVKKFLEREFNVEKCKITRGNVLYCKIREDETVEVEIVEGEIQKMVGEFELVDGSRMGVWVATPEQIIKNKIKAFLDRKKARDLYDIYYLLDFANIDEVKDALEVLVENLEKPKDWDELRDLILVGVAPRFEDVVKKLKRYEV